MLNPRRLLCGSLTFATYFFLICFAHAADVTSTWKGGYGFWTEPTNWLHSLANPGADYPDNDALTYDVEILSGDVLAPSFFGLTVEKFTLGGGTLYHDHTIVAKDRFTWTNGSFTGSGTFTASNGMTIGGADSKSAGAAVFNVFGSSVMTAPGGVTGGSVFNNFGIFEIQSDATMPSFFVNEGVLRKTNSTGTTVFPGTLWSHGALEIESGALSLLNGGKFSGAIRMNTNARMNVSSWVDFTRALDITGRGTLRVTNGGYVIAASNVVSSANVELDDRGYVYVGRSWELTSNANVHLRNGQFHGPGSLIMSAGSLLEVTAGSWNSLWELQITNTETIRFVGPSATVGYGRIENRGLIEFLGDATVTDPDDEHWIVNDALVRKSGAGVAVLEGKRVSNRGVVSVESGTLVFNASGTNTGTFSAAPAATIYLGAGPNSSTFATPVFGNNTLFTGGGTNTIASSVFVSGNVTNDGLLNMSIGQMNGSVASNPAVLHNLSNGVLLISNGGPGYGQFNCIVSNFGNALISSIVSIAFGGRFDNVGVVELQGGEIAGGPFTNYTLLRKITAQPAAITGNWSPYESPRLFSNAGDIEVEAGVLTILVPGSSTGRFSVFSNATLAFAQSQHTLTEGASIKGSGQMLIHNNGTLNVEGNVTNDSPLRIDYSGAVDGSGTLHVSSALDWREGELRGSGKIVIQPAAELRADATFSHAWRDRTIENHGNAVFTGVGQLTGHGGVFNNFGNLRVSNAFYLSWDNVSVKPLLNNYGLLTVSGGLFELSAPFTNHGTVNVQNALLRTPYLLNMSNVIVDGTLDATFVENRDGTMTVRGAIHGSLSNNAVLEIGTGAVQLDVVGDLQLSPASVVHLDLGGTNTGINSDFIRVEGRARFDGTLNIRLINGFQPSLGQRFTLMTFHQGSSYFSDPAVLFSRVHGLNLGNGLRLALDMDVYRKMDLVVVAAAAPGNVPLVIRQTSPSYFHISWPSGFSGFYFQSTTNLSAPWQTLWLTRGDSLEWSTALVIYPETTPRYNQPHRFFRLFDPDSP